jgi:hypothetical protein
MNKVIELYQYKADIKNRKKIQQLFAKTFYQTDFKNIKFRNGNDTDFSCDNVIILCQQPHLEKLKNMKEHLEVIISEMERVD